MPKYILFSTKKVEKPTVLSSQVGASAPSCPPLRTPMWIAILIQNLKCSNYFFPGMHRLGEGRTSHISSSVVGISSHRIVLRNRKIHRRSRTWRHTPQRTEETRRQKFACWGNFVEHFHQTAICPWELFLTNDVNFITRSNPSYDVIAVTMC